VDLREEFNKIIKKYGRPIVYGRCDRRIKCVCTDSLNPSPLCKKCFGTGYKVVFQRCFVRSVSASVPEALVGILRNEEIGFVQPDAWIYYFQYYVHPKAGDLILEVEWDGDKVKSYKKRYVITHVEPKYKESGRVIYYKVVARAEKKVGSIDADV